MMKTPNIVFCAGSEKGEFLFPSDVAVDKCNNVFVSDCDNNRIQVRLLYSLVNVLMCTLVYLIYCMLLYLGIVHILRNQQGGGRGLQMITLHVIVTNITTVKMIASGMEGVWNWSEIDYVNSPLLYRGCPNIKSIKFC